MQLVIELSEIKRLFIFFFLEGVFLKYFYHIIYFL